MHPKAYPRTFKIFFAPLCFLILALLSSCETEVLEPEIIIKNITESAAITIRDTVVVEQDKTIDSGKLEYIQTADTLRENETVELGLLKFTGLDNNPISFVGATYFFIYVDGTGIEDYIDLDSVTFEFNNRKFAYQRDSNLSQNGFFFSIQLPDNFKNSEGKLIVKTKESFPSSTTGGFQFSGNYRYDIELSESEKYFNWLNADIKTNSPGFPPLTFLAN